MKNQRGEATQGGIGILGLLGVIFVVLKILEIKPVGDWSWWWVTAPFWGGFALVAAILVVALLVAWIADICTMIGRKWRGK